MGAPTPRDRLIVALDFPTVDDARRMVAALGDRVTFYKVGLQLVFAGGLPFARELVASGKRLFLDVKLLDIGNTVSAAVESIVALGVDFVTVHGYPQAMRAAVAGRGSSPLKLLAVTVMTSLSDADLEDAGYRDGVADLVQKRSADAKAAGIDGIVAAASEAAAIRRIVGPGMTIVTPGIRPPGAAIGDQKRVATPAEAIAAGADYLVIGRPITSAADPRGAADAIVADIERGLSKRVA